MAANDETNPGPVPRRKKPKGILRRYLSFLALCVGITSLEKPWEEGQSTDEPSSGKDVAK